MGITLVAGISFVDDIHSLPDSVRLVFQFAAMALMFWCWGIVQWNMWWAILIALIVCVGITNAYNFMDGINGINGGCTLALLLPLAWLNESLSFAPQSLIIVAILADLVFCFFNFRPKGKAKCFAGDVGSVGIAYILLFAVAMLIARTGDVTWLVLLLVYGVDGCLTICHRIMLHEHLGEAHRKHMYQLMSNELGMSHPVVALIYMGVQLAVSLGFVFICPLASEACGISLVACHWIYLAAALVILALLYLLFMKKYYHLHEEYLASLRARESLR